MLIVRDLRESTKKKLLHSPKKRTITKSMIIGLVAEEGFEPPTFGL